MLVWSALNRRSAVRAERERELTTPKPAHAEPDQLKVDPSKPGPSKPGHARLAYIDWMRGLACIFMFQTHCYDSWLSPEARKGKLLYWSQLGGTMPAPTFLFLAGFSFAFVTIRLRRKGADPNQVARQTILHGAEVLGFGFLFRLQEFILGWGWAPWTDLLRVDVLNIIGVSMILMGVVVRVSVGRSVAGSLSAGDFAELARKRNAWAGAAVCLAVALLTPLLYTVWRPRWLPWPLESYVNGVHTFNAPQPWLFPVFPWAGFAFLGLATGFVILSDWARTREAQVLTCVGVAGLALIAAARAFEASSYRLPLALDPVHDFWHTSLTFFLIRVGMLLVILWFSYLWCVGGWGQRGFSPLIQLGQTSLLVYWVHIEFVYGKFSILPKRASSALAATLGLFTIFAAMLLLSLARTKWKTRA
jgi:uncharacterized membrane protein